MSKDILITGASGFIGSHLLRRLLDQAEYSSYIVVDRVAPSVNDPRVQFFERDIRKPISLPKMRRKPAACVHLAAVAKEPGYPWEEYFRTNFIGTQNLVALAEQLKIDNIVYTSTMMVYRAGEEQFDEEGITAPDTGYGMSKLLGEFALLEWAAKSGRRRLRIVRPGVVFGKGEDGNYLRLYRALKWNLFAYIGRKNTVKSSVYVKDLVHFLEFLLDDRKVRRVYNLAIPEELTIETICRSICDAYDWRRIIPVIPYRLALAFGYSLESLRLFGLNKDFHHRRIEKLYYSTNISSKAAVAAGFHFKFPLREALKDWQRESLPGELS